MVRLSKRGDEVRECANWMCKNTFMIHRKKKDRKYCDKCLTTKGVKNNIYHEQSKRIREVYGKYIALDIKPKSYYDNEISFSISREPMRIIQELENIKKIIEFDIEKLKNNYSEIKEELQNGRKD